MNFWNVLKYALMVVFAIILGVAAYVTSGDDTATPIQQPINQPGQSKFNF